VLGERAQRKEGVGVQLTELDLDGENGAEAVTVMFRGGARAALGEELKKGASGSLDGKDPLVARLRSKTRGQNGRGFHDGE
jgi:hypothetical protein